ncbi:MAG: hypothetical protein QM775_02605 [Pirellulales bacterium]
MTGAAVNEAPPIAGPLVGDDGRDCGWGDDANACLPDGVAGFEGAGAAGGGCCFTGAAGR